MTLGQMKDAFEALQRRLPNSTQVIPSDDGVIIMGGNLAQAHPSYLKLDELSKLANAEKNLEALSGAYASASQLGNPLLRLAEKP